jgi:hypothetical protein
MRPVIFAVLSVLLAGGTLSAQVRGKVIEVSDSGDTTVVPGVILFWDEHPAEVVTTNEKGNFSMKSVQLPARLNMRALGYENRHALIKDTSRFAVLVLKPNISLSEVEVVYYTTGTEISWLNPVKMELLNERSLMKAACCNLSESFETNPSIDVNFTDAVSGTRQIQMLGLSGQYAQITKENMPYMRGLANNYGLTFIPGTWIQSIQLSKGAGSVINGYESFTGQINTELQNPAGSDKLHFNTYVNENGRNEYNLNLSRRINPALAVGLLSHASFNPVVQDHNGDGFADIPTGRQYNVMNKYSLSLKNGFEAQFGGGYLYDDRNGGQFSSIFKPTGDSVPLYKIGIKNQKWEVYSKTGYVFKEKPGTSMGLQLSYLDHQQDNFYGYNNYSGYQQTFYSNFIYQGIIGSTNHTYKVGASFLNDNVGESYNSVNYKRLEQAAGIFSEYAYNYKQKFNLVAGLRGDYHNLYGFFVTPRLHLRYAFTPSSVLRLSGGSALRTANIFTDNSNLMASSRIWNIVATESTLPYGLKPERGWNYGLNFTQKFKFNYRDAYATLDVYRTDFVSQVVVDVDRDPQAVWIYNLKGPSYSNTLQFEVNVEPRKRFFVKAAYRYVDTRVQFKEGLLKRALVAKDRAFLNLSYETSGGHWQFDQTTQFNGSKRLPQTRSNPDDLRRENNSPAYFNLIGQITYLTRFGRSHFHVYLGVENLLNYKQTDPIVSSDAPFSRYFDASMVWGPVYGRMLYAGMRLKIK